MKMFPNERPDRMRHFLILSLMVTIVFTGGCASLNSPRAVGDAPPVIDAYFASPECRWGETWKIFIKAHDPDGDLRQIRFDPHSPGNVDDTGLGMVILGDQFRREIDGFFYMFLPPRGWPVGFINMSMTVYLVDAGGRSSRKIVLPLYIGATPQTSPPREFTPRAIGPVNVSLITAEYERPGFRNRND
jgi:hypothetical protein